MQLIIHNIHFIFKEQGWHEFADFAGITLTYYNSIAGNDIAISDLTVLKYKDVFLALDL